MGISLDKLAARRHVIAHQHGECTFRFGGIVYGNLTEKPLLRVHSRIPELLVAHLSETFVPLDRYALVRSFSKLCRSIPALLFRPAVNFLPALLHQIKRRCRKVDIPVPDG